MAITDAVADPVEGALEDDLEGAPADELLGWYDRNRRNLPWRVGPGELADPYRVWLSEIMLQQTTVAAVRPYFEAFVRRWPTVHDLAAAEPDAVMHAWQGLGYYARARNMHRCARIVAGEMGGRFPESESNLRCLPGIGIYTAAAIAAIAFAAPAVVVDGNVQRVMARLFRVETSLPAAAAELRHHAAELTPESRPGDYAQAVMDLGATVCTRYNPACDVCPWGRRCRGRAVAAALPRRTPRPVRPARSGTAFWITRQDGAVLLRRRHQNGLLGGMMEIPSTDWRDGALPSLAVHLGAAPLAVSQWQEAEEKVRHGFTHFHLELRIAGGRVENAAPLPDCLWCLPEHLGEHALPTLMKKVARVALHAFDR